MVDLEKLLPEIQKMNPWNLLLLIVGYGVAKLPQFVLTKDKQAIEARDALIAIMQKQITDLQAEIKELKKELAEMRGDDRVSER